MTIPQGIWQASSNIITPVEFAATAPIYAVSSAAGVIVGSTVGGALNVKGFPLTTDFVTTYVTPINTPFVANQVMMSFSYQPSTPNCVIQFRFFITSTYTFTVTSESGGIISLYDSAVVGQPSVYVGRQSENALPGNGIKSEMYTFTYNEARATLPSTITFYLCGGTVTGGQTTRFISNTSTYFGGTARSYVLVNSAV
jgi:hypothetical protein